MFGSNFTSNLSLSDLSYAFVTFNCTLNGKSRSTDPGLRKIKSSNGKPQNPVSLLSTSFSIPSIKQLWPFLGHMLILVKGRSGRVNQEDIQQAEAKQNGKPLPLIMILDIKANLNIFRNPYLLENIKSVPMKGKSICSASGLFQCDNIGKLSLRLVKLPLPASDYYYSVNIMANILSVGILSETHCVFMESSIDNTLYIFDEDGRHLQFFNCSITRLYWL